MSSNHYIHSDGAKRWFNENYQLHRDGVLPAIEYDNGGKEWWKYDHLHREQDKPAVEWANGYKEWWKHGKMLSSQEVEALQRKWTAIRNGNTDLLAEELLNEL